MSLQVHSRAEKNPKGPEKAKGIQKSIRGRIPEIPGRVKESSENPRRDYRSKGVSRSTQK